MARYIDADELRRRVKEKTNPYGKPDLDYESGVKVLNMIDNAPTADVAPKSEVEKLQNELVIWKQNRFNLYQKLECYETARQKVAREIFEEIERVISEQYENYVFDNLEIEGVEQDAIIAFADTMKRHFAELKKKYTEKNGK